MNAAKLKSTDIITIRFKDSQLFFSFHDISDFVAKRKTVGVF